MDAANWPQSSASQLRDPFGSALQRSACGPEPLGEVSRAGIGRHWRPVERGDRHHAPYRVRQKEAPPGELLSRVATLVHTAHELEYARPPDAGQDAQVE